MSDWEKKYKNFINLTDDELREIYSKPCFKNHYNFYFLKPERLKDLVIAIKELSEQALENKLLLTPGMLAHKLGVSISTLKVWRRKLKDVGTAYEYYISKMRVLYDQMEIGFFNLTAAKEYKINSYNYEAFKTFGRHMFNIGDNRICEIDGLADAKTVAQAKSALNTACSRGELSANEYVQISTAISSQMTAEKTEKEIEAYQELERAIELKQQLDEIIGEQQQDA